MNLIKLIIVYFNNLKLLADKNTWFQGFESVYGYKQNKVK